MRRRVPGAIDFSSRDVVLNTARAFEDLGVAAYNGYFAPTAFDDASAPQAVIAAASGAAFCVTGLAKAGLIPAEDMQSFTTIRDHEVARVEYLKSALGSPAVAKPTFDFTAADEPLTKAQVLAIVDPFIV